MRKSLIVALDLPTVRAAKDMSERLRAHVDAFKVGLALLFKPSSCILIAELVERGKRVFVDAKLFDIGETVARAAHSLARQGVHMLTVRNDPKIIEAAVRGRGGLPVKVFAVTALTDRGEQVVLDDVRRAVDAGCDGIICAGSDDVPGFRAAYPQLEIACPGIRLPGGAQHDQRRVCTPGQALARGADYVIVGRPVVTAADPVAAVQEIYRSVEGSAA